MNITAYLQGLSDDALLNATKTAGVDLEKAAADEHGSEWHQSCFAAAVLYAQELGRRGLTIAPNPAPQHE